MTNALDLTIFEKQRKSQINFDRSVRFRKSQPSIFDNRSPKELLITKHISNILPKTAYRQVTEIQLEQPQIKHKVLGILLIVLTIFIITMYLPSHKILRGSILEKCTQISLIGVFINTFFAYFEYRNNHGLVINHKKTAFCILMKSIKVYLLFDLMEAIPLSAIGIILMSSPIVEISRITYSNHNYKYRSILAISTLLCLPIWFTFSFMNVVQSLILFGLAYKIQTSNLNFAQQFASQTSCLLIYFCVISSTGVAYHLLSGWTVLSAVGITASTILVKYYLIQKIIKCFIEQNLIYSAFKLSPMILLLDQKYDRKYLIFMMLATVGLILSQYVIKQQEQISIIINQ